MSSQNVNKARLDPYLLLATLLLIVTGLVALYSEGHGQENSQWFSRQLIAIAIGTIPFFVFFRVNFSFWKRASNFLYLLNLFLLALVYVPGLSGGGNANRWVGVGFMQFQPSEAGKLLTILTLAAFYASRSNEPKKFSIFALSFLHILPPLLLIFKQPHLGASMVIVVSWLMISYFAGVSGRLILTVCVSAVMLLGSAMLIPGVLKPYQKERIYAMFGHDAQGRDYQQINAKIAIGSGGVSGVGFLKGKHKVGRFVPEQRNDFIFTVIGEEFGLIGSTLVLSFFGFFFYRAWLLLNRASDAFAKMVLSGIITMLAFHMSTNLGMNLHIAPVVGLWLPFVSYGGTAIWLCLACVGLMFQIHGNEKKLNF